MFSVNYVDPRRRQELKDSKMIEPDHTAMANCPRQAIHHEWPKSPYAINGQHMFLTGNQ